jgi:hypothetical protein
LVRRIRKLSLETKEVHLLLGSQSSENTGVSIQQGDHICLTTSGREVLNDHKPRLQCPSDISQPPLASPQL